MGVRSSPPVMSVRPSHDIQREKKGMGKRGTVPGYNVGQG